MAKKAKAEKQKHVAEQKRLEAILSIAQWEPVTIMSTKKVPGEIEGAAD